MNIGTQFFGQGLRGSSVNVFKSINSFSTLVSLFLKFAFALAGLTLLFYFILGGFGMVASAGKNDPKAMEQAKASITTAVIGFIVVIMAYAIVKLVVTLIGQPNLI